MTIEEARERYLETISDMTETINGLPKHGSKCLIKKRFGAIKLLQAIYINGRFHTNGGEILEGSLDVSYWKYDD